MHGCPVHFQETPSAGQSALFVLYRQARARTESQGLLRPNPSKTLNGQGGNVCGGLVHCGRLGGSFCLGLGFKQEGLNRLLTVACGHDETAPVFL